jgi:hypothetical protein
MSTSDKTHLITVPGQREALVPPSAARIRALRRHLIEAIRDLVKARRPDRLIQRRTVEPTGFRAAVVSESCGHCRGSCCMAGGTHAFLDERTMARVHAEQPNLTARQVVRAYIGAVAPLAYRDSCLFHGETGCNLARPLRAELCNSYYCNGLLDFLNAKIDAGHAVKIVTHAEQETGTVRVNDPAAGRHVTLDAPAPPTD